MVFAPRINQGNGKGDRCKSGIEMTEVSRLDHPARNGGDRTSEGKGIPMPQSSSAQGPGIERLRQFLSPRVEQRRNTKSLQRTMCGGKLSSRVSASTANTKKQENSQVCSRLCRDPRPISHVWCGEGSKERELDFSY